MNEQFKPSFNTTVKPSDTRYNTLIFLTILIILLLAGIHLYRYGFDMNIKIPTNSDVLIAKKEIPQEVMETAQKVKEHLKQMNGNPITMKEDPTTMQQIYYYGKFIVITAAVVGLLYLWFKYETSLPDTGSTGPKLPDKLADYTDRQALDSLRAGTLFPINVNGNFTAK